jgi:pimeloyl-ACP methyl ester carboxylesterase
MPARTKREHRRRRPLRWWQGLGLLAAVLLLSLLTVVLGNGLRMLAVESQPHDQPGPGRGRWLPADDVRLHVTEHGPADGPRLVLVAGTGAWGGTWAGNIEAITALGWRVITIDLPPFGFSARPANHSYTRHAQAQRLLAALRAVAAAGTPPVVLLGHSYGGGPAAEAAMLDATLIRHLILVDAAIGLRAANDTRCEVNEAADMLLSWRPLRTLFVANTATQPLFTLALLRQFVARKEVVTAERAAIYSQPFAVRGTSAALGDWAQQFATSCESARSQTAVGFAAMKPPLTLLWGELDSITPPHQARQLAAATPGASLVMLPGVGHIPQLEDPAAFNRALAGVLSGLR